MSFDDIWFLFAKMGFSTKCHDSAANTIVVLMEHIDIISGDVVA